MSHLPRFRVADGSLTFFARSEERYEDGQLVVVEIKQDKGKRRAKAGYGIGVVEDGKLLLDDGTTTAISQCRIIGAVVYKAATLFFPFVCLLSMLTA